MRRIVTCGSGMTRHAVAGKKNVRVQRELLRNTHEGSWHM